jgi:mono/diheme cytochrome c family protein
LIRTNVGAMNSQICLLLSSLFFAAALWSTDLAAQTPAQAGAILYANRCAGCHGEELQAYSGGQAFDLRRLRPDEYDRFVQSVISGKDNMPSWYGILKPAEIDAIWAHIRATVDR